jgi:hypothetical protein
MKLKKDVLKDIIFGFKKGTNIKHNPCGPAMIYYADGGFIEREWWLNGLMHREDGPAFEGRSYELWYIYGKCHRLDGPANINFSVNRTLLVYQWLSM